jgi:type II secretory pathway pseudopilin PulG
MLTTAIIIILLSILFPFVGYYFDWQAEQKKKINKF